MSIPINNFKVDPDNLFNLSRISTSETPYTEAQNRAGIKKELKLLNKKLQDLQEVLWAEKKHRVLVVLQAMDAGGKDGSIKKVFKGVNPSGVRIESFKKPNDQELAHDYLWRVHKKVPQTGELTIFNRSHYEDVLVVRVMDLVDQSIWQQRYEHIRNFEQLLVDEGTTIIKFYLHISKNEQRRRLQARLDEPEKNWKFNLADLEHRVKWEAYREAFQDALAKTSTAQAPWYVIPADKKWYRDLVMTNIIVQTLEKLEMRFPASSEGLEKIRIP